MENKRVRAMRNYLVTQLEINPHKMLNRQAGDVANNGFENNSDRTTQWGDSVTAKVTFHLEFKSTQYNIVGFDDAGNTIAAHRKTSTGAEFEHPVAWIAWHESSV